MCLSKGKIESEIAVDGGGRVHKKKPRKENDLRKKKIESVIGGDGGGVEKKKLSGGGKEKDEKRRIEKTGVIVRKKRKNTEIGIDEDDDYPYFQHLPEEFVIQNILTKLAAGDLAKCSFMSKLWYNSIYNDKPFAATYFSQNQNKPSLFFSLLNCTSNRNKKDNSENKAYFFIVEKENNKYKKDRILDFTCRHLGITQHKNEPVGYCNGLACLKIASEDVVTNGVISVINPTRAETLFISYLPPYYEEYMHLCHGFGFDSLSQLYKVVLIFTSRTNQEFLSMVFTLGTNSWRKSVTSVSQMPPPPGCSPFPSRMVTRVYTNFCASSSATLCGDDLLWRITNQVLEEDDGSNDKTEMLLSFDLHKEKIQFIGLPTESTLTGTVNEPQNLIADHYQLLEFKGYPCIARFEKIMNTNSNPSSCCCKVHLHILKDKVKQEWIKGETFDVQIEGLKGLLPGFCCYFDPATSTPPMRVLAFQDHLLLYWFDGKCLTYYNLQTKHLEVVRGSSSYPTIFKTKRKATRPATVVGCGDANGFCPYMDYQLDAQVENFHSLKTFIPEGEVSKPKCFDDSMQLMSDKLPAGWLITGREVSTQNYYAFF